MARCKHNYVKVRIRTVAGRQYVTFECIYCGDSYEVIR